LHRDLRLASPEEDGNRIIFCQEDKMAKIKEFLGLRAGSKASISADGQVATITFSDLAVEVGNTNTNLALGATQVESFTLQLSENTVTEFPVQMYASGLVFTQLGARALLVAHMGETTAIASSSKPLGDAQGFVSDKPPTASSPETPGLDTGYVQALEAIVPAGVAVQITLFLLADRYKGAASFDVLALDFNLDRRTVDR
jgi:hypothetical protein